MRKEAARKKVLVTGGTSGIGGAIALAFARNGWDVVLHYRKDTASAKDIARSIKDMGVLCDIYKADFLIKKEVSGFLRRIERLAPDSVINNAGSWIRPCHFTVVDMDVLSDSYVVNAAVPALIAARIFEGMKRRGFGRIVNISSIAAKYGGGAGSLHYGMSKRALEAMTRTFAREGASSNVLVNTIRPGVIDTDFHRKFPKDMAARVGMIPMKKMGGPGDVAKIVYFLGSGENLYITGQTVSVSGGE